MNMAQSGVPTVMLTNIPELTGTKVCNRLRIPALIFIEENEREAFSGMTMQLNKPSF